jgi:hypothetical protein
VVIARRSRMLTVVLALVALGGCRDSDLKRVLDDDSNRRLDAAPADATLLISLRAGADPVFDDHLRLIERAGGTLLVEASRESANSLGGLPDVTHAAVWGAGDVLRKLDPALRGELLGSLDTADKDDATLPIIATFAAGATGVEAAIAGSGASLRSLTGTIATLDATPAAALRLLEWPQLVELEKPNTLRPLEGR